MSLFVCSEQWGGAVRDIRPLLGRGRVCQLHQRGTEGACPLAYLLCPDGYLCPSPHDPAAAAGPAVPTQKQLG